MATESKIEKQTRNKNVKEIEDRLNELVATDIENEEIYVLLKRLAYIYINQNKYTFGYNGIEDVCHDVAADVWMSVLNGREIKAWIYYIGKMIKLSYVKRQRNIEHEIIETSDDPVLAENVKRMCASSAMSCTKDFDIMIRNTLMENIDSIIYETMTQSKFKANTKEWLAVYTNVCLNLINDIDGKPYSYIRIEEHLKPYVQLCINQFKKNFRNCGFCESLSDNVEDDIEMKLTATDDYRKGLFDR